MAYYVTVQDDQGRSGFLAGPFALHGDALRRVHPVRQEAHNVNPREATTARFGTARVKTPDLVERIGAGRLNARLGLPGDGARIGRLP